MPRDLLNATSLKARLAKAIDEATETHKTVTVLDGDGLMLFVRANGEASWVLRYRLHGKRSDMTLGRWPATTLAAAREARKAADKLLAAGTDPMAHRSTAREKATAAATTTDTVLFIFKAWHASLARGKKPMSEVSLGNIQAAFTKNVLPVIGAVPAHQVTRDQIQKLLRVIEDRGAFDMVRRVRMWLRQMFEWGAGHEQFTLLTTSPVPMGTLRTMGFTSSTSEDHYPAIINPKEVPALMRKLLNVDHFAIRTALLMSAHTFQRPAEIREVTWAEIDLDAAKWTIPAERMGKTQREHWVPLSRQMVALLRIHAGCYGDEGYLFPGRNYRSGNKAMSEGTLTGRLNTMGYLGIHCPHGFRAMARTIGHNHLKIPKEWLEKQLSHDIDTSGLNGAYGRFSPGEYWDERVAMMQQWSDWLDAMTRPLAADQPQEEPSVPLI